MGAAPGRPARGGDLRPLYALDAPCQDPRFPALAGPWAVGCGPDGRVDRVIFLPTRARYDLPVALSAPCLAPGWLWDPGGPGRLLRLEGSRATPIDAPAAPSPAGPCAVSESRLATQSAQHLSVGPHRGARAKLPARPLGWSPLALADRWIAWVEATAPGLPQVYGWDGTGPATPLGPPGSRHVVGAGGRLAWVEPGAVARWTPGGTLDRWPADTGFSAGLGFDGELLCWETRGPADLDLRCSDGLVIDGPGHQRAPSQWGPYLLYRAEGHTWLHTRGPEAP